MTENLRDLFLTLPIIALGRNGLNILIILSTQERIKKIINRKIAKIINKGMWKLCCITLESTFQRIKYHQN